MPFVSDPELLTLHALRLRGMADVDEVARRFGLDRALVRETLLDAEAYGWARRVRFAGTGGWTLTEAGREVDDRRLASELAASGAAELVGEVHAAFLPLNARFQTVVTRWQLRPVGADQLAANDHSDPRWDDRVIAELGVLGRRLAPLCEDLAARLERFAGYGERYATAYARVGRGERGWVDEVGLDSCHRVWLELHEDLLATLGIQRGEES